MSKNVMLENDTFLSSNSVGIEQSYGHKTLGDIIKSSPNEPVLKTPGWYRIAKIFYWGYGDYNYKPSSILVHLGVSFDYYNGSTNLVSICKGGSATSIKLLNNANGSTKCISKIRVCSKDSVTHYLDIYWNVGNDTNGNHLHYDILSFGGKTTILTPTAVTDSDTYTVKATLDI